ncbi:MULTISPECIES: DNA-binding anti-repressor SinI [Bacillus]|uniref:DNA-binding transcriptional MerR regulator n=1 Tax=Bacillus capparidis TaxID=1840411 RepID=A0ABS4CY75_9BACI|nr:MULTISPECIES: DNA-binding anti-repressor SinI [Bacillus]MBP1082313.1 DNA-binding transcriptional MerR regulator [Bacillus capparidis]MED1097427.1 DNA-binding anti-repressor SinI [Bacillus capparidis]
MDYKKLNLEWRVLILHALEIGIKPNEIKEFFKKYEIRKPE